MFATTINICSSLLVIILTLYLFLTVVKKIIMLFEKNKEDK